LAEEQETAAAWYILQVANICCWGGSQIYAAHKAQHKPKQDPGGKTEIKNSTY